jgi:sortase (surface protein transpeptidase)
MIIKNTVQAVKQQTIQLLEKRRVRREIESVLLDYSDLKKAKALTKLAQIMAIVGVLVIYAGYLPSLYYWALGKVQIEGNSKIIAETAMELSSSAEDKKNPKETEIYQPQYDPTLPTDNMFVITKLGIDTPIYEVESSNYEEALKKGVWRVSDFGNPYDRSSPTILAAHRFGYLKWSIPFRLKNSFFKLPKLSVGDTVEIVWNQRKYTYGVYKEEEGEEVGDYSADLILYTCRNLNSPKRIFKYARLLEI